MGDRFRSRNKPRRALTLIELIIVTSIIAVLAALVVPGLLRTRMVSNEAVAKATLRTISNAIEMYIAAKGTSPTAEDQLLSPAANPPFLSQAYDGQTVRGYAYQYNFDNGYTVTATPQACKRTGSKTFTVTNNQISEAACVEE
ncbi:MAG TPA: prepilin-type N-terminal cleavage/methylation domain-containing protein [Patescibacteria group bacterium]|nr:prepilin-type N-terminal cleavage/methylation domain-containing protein [Patescibacteria group bacterium]